MHKLGIQVLPSPGMMAIMGGKVAMLSVGLGDTLMQFTIEQSATGFKESLVCEPHGIKQSRRHILQGGHVEHRFGGHARTLHRSARLQEDAGFPAAWHQAEQTGEGIWITTRFGGHTHTLHHGGVCGGLQEDVGSPDARHQAEQRSYGLHAIVEFDVPISPR
ncbi:unnamed protein product [Symbiodinium necroappetens]|uniref:Uncharacterized protein n=1 Tax=Symbiodinium necroappetens TaxID=1628268 RepID=A0A812ZNM3_9DINO|nr:unnamed protein product [Symbiodinium necroappetens]